jgi:hypothetical protein
MMAETAGSREQTRTTAKLAGRRELVLDGEQWNITESRVPGTARETVYLIRFSNQGGRELTVTLPISSTTLTDTELTDVWLRCLIWEQDA